MEIFSLKNEIKEYILIKKREGKKIGLVPTMGFLHEGHCQLIRKARSECEIVVLSIFVNPTQFGPSEDFNKYPRDFQRDKSLAIKEGVDIIFCPEVKEMYGENSLAYVDIKKISKIMCGKFRPGHFRGVCSVVLKLFNIIMPDAAYFGLKDYQQYLIIKKMVEDLDLNLEVFGCETVREKDGLAMSSRNKYLSESERENSLVLYHSLNLAAKNLIEKKKSIQAIKKQSMQMLEENKYVNKIDYFDIRNADDLSSVSSYKQKTFKILIASAIYIGKTRLIDNIAILI